MASSKVSGKKQDEKHLKVLREMAALSTNRHCFECGQRGPTYVNMTIGAFVCTACSGILRGLNPPHRVKSISMASFSPEEIDFLKEHGNEYNRHVWLGLHDNKSPPSFEPSEEHKLREYMTQKYERKRWYLEPTAELKEQAKAWNAAASVPSLVDGAAKTRSGSTLGPLPSATAAAVAAGTISRVQTLSSSTVTAGIAVTQQSLPSHGIASSAAPSSDLLSDLFAPPPTSATPAAHPNFGAFPAVFPAASNHPGQQQGGFVPNFGTSHGHTGTPGTVNASLSPLLPGASPQRAVPAHHLPAASTAAGSGGVSSSLGGDKYAALADLFDTHVPAPAPAVPHHQDSSAAINWNPVDWSGAASSGAGYLSAAPAASSSGAGYTAGGGSTHQKVPTTMGNSMGWASSATSASWPNGNLGTLPSAQPVAASSGFTANNAFPVAWNSAATASAPGPAAPSGTSANPFISATMPANAAGAMSFASFPGAAAQSKVSAFGGQAVGLTTASAAPHFGTAQHGYGGGQGLFATSAASSMPFQASVHTPVFTMQAAPVAASLPPAQSYGVQQNGMWAQPAAWSQGPPIRATSSANPFAGSAVGMPSNNPTNPFL